jgi:hypothetical protein
LPFFHGIIDVTQTIKPYVGSLGSNECPTLFASFGTSVVSTLHFTVSASGFPQGSILQNLVSAGKVSDPQVLDKVTPKTTNINSFLYYRQ